MPGTTQIVSVVIRSIHINQVCEPHMTWAPKVFNLSGVKWSQAKKQFIVFPLYKPWGSQWNTTQKSSFYTQLVLKARPSEDGGCLLYFIASWWGFPFKHNLWGHDPQLNKTHRANVVVTLYGGFEDALRVLNKCVNLNSVEMLVGDRNPSSIFLMGC